MMKNRKPKKYTITWNVILRDCRGNWSERVKTIYRDTAARDCRKMASFTGSTIVAVIDKHYRGI